MKNAAPLTAEMQGALDLARAKGGALARIYSQWWGGEADATAWHRDKHSGEDITVVRTGTVNALVARGLMRFTGPKRSGPGYRTPSYTRAELT